MRKNTLSAAALGAAIVGILAGSATLAGCSQPDASAQSGEKNACGGPNGCGADKKPHDKNACGGPNGCNGTEKAGEKKGEANACGAHNGCNASEKAKTPAK